MSDLTLFKVAEGDEITSEDVARRDLSQEIQTAPKGAWARDQDWPVLFARVQDEDDNEATIVVPFDDPRDFRRFLDDGNLDQHVVVEDFDMTLLEEIEQEMA